MFLFIFDGPSRSRPPDNSPPPNSTTVPVETSPEPFSLFYPVFFSFCCCANFRKVALVHSLMAPCPFLRWTSTPCYVPFFFPPCLPVLPNAGPDHPFAHSRVHTVLGFSRLPSGMCDPRAFPPDRLPPRGKSSLLCAFSFAFLLASRLFGFFRFHSCPPLQKVLEAFFFAL